jgi:hypothetical protein
MAVLRLDRRPAGPDGTAAAAAVKDAFPGLIEAQLAKAGDRP